MRTLVNESGGRGRRVGAVVFALGLCVAWGYATALLLGWIVLLESRGTILCVQWSGGAALIALTARIAGRRRWALGIPLLLLFGFLGLLYELMLLLGPGSAPGVRPGVLLGVLLFGPAILAVPAAAQARQGAPEPILSDAARTSPRWLFRRESLLWTAVIGTLLAALLAILGKGAIDDLRLRRIHRDVFSAAKDLVETDVLSVGGIVWMGPEQDDPSMRMPAVAWLRGYGWIPGADVRLEFEDWEHARASGTPGKAEGLRADGLRIFVPQARVLDNKEMKDLQVLKPLLLSAGVRPELVSRLTPDMTATYRGVTYRFAWNVERRSDTCIGIDCSGVRSGPSS